MTAQTHQRAAGPRRIVRAAAALGALGLLVGAVPVVLVTLTGALPVDLGALSPTAWGRADDGRLLLLVIVAVAWVAWAVMVLSVAVETWSAVRRVPTPAVPGLAVPQRWAAALVAAVLVALSPAAGTPVVAAPAALGDVTGMAVVAAAPHTADRVGAQDRDERTGELPVGRRALDHASRHTTIPTVTTERHDTLWMLAEQYLGAGERYLEIVELNRGAKQPDGRSLGDDGRIYPGWSLALPADAALDAARPERHHVTRGDTLWQIADEELGDPSRYPEIVEANRGDLQPDGHRLADPDLILPGWVLEIPRVEPGPSGLADSAPAARAQDATGALPETPDAEPTRPATAQEPALEAGGSTAGETDGADTSQVPVPSATSMAPIDRAPAATAVTGAAPAASIPPGAAAGSAAGAPTLDRGPADPAGDSAASERDPAAPTTDVDDPAPTSSAASQAAIALPAGGAVAALLLAGMGAELVRRRRQFQRHRRPGERMPLPEPGARQVERAARIAGGEPGLDLFDRALVQLAEQAQAAGLQLPDVRLVRVGPQTLILDLAAPAGPAIAPFVTVDDTRWELSPGLLPTQVPDRPRALPGLVTVGFAGPETVLLNLESVGTLAVTGPDELTGDVVRGLAADLAFGPASAQTERTLCLADPAIAEAVEAGDLAVEGDPVRAAAALRAALAHPARTGPGPVDPSADDPPADDPLLIVLCDRSLDVRVPPRAGCALITTVPGVGAGATLVVDEAGMAVLLPERAHLVPQGLSRTATGDVVAALRATDLLETGPSGAQAHAGDGREDAASGLHDEAGLTPVQASPWGAGAATPEVIDLRERSADPVPAPDPRSSRAQPPDVAAVPASSPGMPAAGHASRDSAAEGVPEVPGADAAAAEPASDRPAAEVPRVLLLGEVLVENAHGKCESTRIGRLAETAAFVLLNPGARPSELQGALWPDRRSNPQTCRQMISRARTWLGRTDGGEPYLMTFAESAGRLRLRDEVSSDWADFQRLAEIGLADAEDTEHLTQALALVRGRPFGAVASRELPWADIHINEMISRVSDVAHALAVRHEAAGRRSAARDAALRGLQTECESEVLEAIVARTRS